MEPRTSLRRGSAKFAGARGGNIAVIAAIALPLLFGGAALAIDFVNALSSQQNLQDAADGAALAAATELPLRSTNEAAVDSIVEAFVVHNLGETTELAEIDAEILENRGGVRVRLVSQVNSIFGDMFNPDGYGPRVEAVARLSGGAPLCALALEERRNRAIVLEREASILAPDCAVVSNSTSPQGIVAQDSTALQATMICSAGGFSGPRANFSPEPITDCPAIPDPLAQRPEPNARGCTRLLQLNLSGTQTLRPGVYCGGITVMPGATVNLSPGIYVIKNGPLVVHNRGTLNGDGVGFYFVGDLSTMTFHADSNINLSAPTDGEMAGFLLFANRVLLTGDLNLRRFRIFSNNARNLLGTIYLRDGVLEVASQRPIADRSSYTVVVARRIEVSAGPDLVLNTDYDGTDVPVPEGVGPRRPQAFLAD